MPLAIGYPGVAAGGAIEGTTWIGVANQGRSFAAPGRTRRPSLHKHSYSSPSSFHFLSTNVLVFSSMRISSGQGRLKPSLDHLRVASIPIFDP